MKKLLRILIRIFMVKNAVFLVDLCWGSDLWKLRESCLKSRNYLKVSLYYTYLEYFGSWIGLDASFRGKPHFPHGYYGIFISQKAKIGKGAVIYHQVTIGSNTSIGSKLIGAPTIGDNVYIGSGAKIIGNIEVGNNVRIGANCIVTKNIPKNCVCVMRGMEAIHKEHELDNRWIEISKINL